MSPAPFMLDAQGYAAPTHPDLQVRFVAMRERFAQRQSMSPWFLFPRALRVSVSNSARELSGPRVGPAGRGLGSAAGRPSLFQLICGSRAALGPTSVCLRCTY